MDAGAADANEDAQIPRRPSWTCRRGGEKNKYLDQGDEGQ